MSSKIIAAIIIVAILLIGLFLLVPTAFEGVVPDAYMPEESVTPTAEIHWQTRSSDIKPSTTLAEDLVESFESKE